MFIQEPMPTLYQLKPRFQALLRPLLGWLDRHGVTANAVTWCAMLASVLYALWMAYALSPALFASEPLFAEPLPPGNPPPVPVATPPTSAMAHTAFILLPLFLLLRMALNAIDGMLAREFGQQSPFGAILNEVGDVVSDSALYAPFALLPGVSPIWLAIVIFLAVLTELVGVLGQVVGADRRYDGPMGKSDRALVFGALGLLWGLGVPLTAFWPIILALTTALLITTIANRVRQALRSRTQTQTQAD